MPRNSKRNWDRVKNQRYLDTAQGRDVYDEQQFGRGKLQEKQTMTSRMIGAGLLGLLAFIVVYMLWSSVVGMMSGFADLSDEITRYDDKKAGQVAGVCVYQEPLMMLDTGEARDLEGNIYVSDANGWYVKTEETMAMRYGEDALRLTEEAAAASQEPVTWIHLPKDDEEAESEPVEEAPYWTNMSEHDAGEGFDATISRGELILTPLLSVGLYRDDEGHLYEIQKDHGVQVHADMNRYFKDNPDKIPAKKSSILPTSAAQVFAAFAVGALVFVGMVQVLKKNLTAQNMLADTEDINQYTNDQHITLPEQAQRRYNWFPDVGAHSSVEVSSMLSHMALLNKGVNRIRVAKRYEQDVLDEDGIVVYHKGEIMRDENGEAITEMLPMFDEKFADALFEASGAPEDVRVKYDPSVIPYNPDNKNRSKLQGKDEPEEDGKKKGLFGRKKVAGPTSRYEMVTDLINKDWTFPEYEPQRPAGAYIVDSEPVNTIRSYAA